MGNPFRKGIPIDSGLGSEMETLSDIDILGLSERVSHPGPLSIGKGFRS